MQHRYPESCLQFQYDPEFPIRGIFYDKKNGCLLKLDFFHNIEPDGCYYGRRKMSKEEIEHMLDFDACYVYEDMKRAIVYVHQSGLVHRRILAKPDKYMMEGCTLCSRHYDMEKDIVTFSKVNAFQPHTVY